MLFVCLFSLMHGLVFAGKPTEKPAPRKPPTAKELQRRSKSEAKSLRIKKGLGGHVASHRITAPAYGRIMDDGRRRTQAEVDALNEKMQAARGKTAPSSLETQKAALREHGAKTQARNALVEFFKKYKAGQEWDERNGLGLVLRRRRDLFNSLKSNTSDAVFNKSLCEEHLKWEKAFHDLEKFFKDLANLDLSSSNQHNQYSGCHARIKTRMQGFNDGRGIASFIRSLTSDKDAILQTVFELPKIKDNKPTGKMRAYEKAIRNKFETFCDELT